MGGGKSGAGVAVLDKRGEKCDLGRVTNGKHETLRRILQGYGSCLVAYSGGVDSVLLAKVAREVLGARSLAVIADSPSLPRRELAEALAVAKQFSIPCGWCRWWNLIIPRTWPIRRTGVISASTSCLPLVPLAREEKFAVIAYGENASDGGITGRAPGGGRIPGAVLLKEGG